MAKNSWYCCRTLALAIGERIRPATETAVFDNILAPQPILTVSIGVSQFGHDGTSTDTIFRATDERLFQDKGQGRNCVIAA